jgi:hypothetical protein
VLNVFHDGVPGYRANDPFPTSGRGTAEENATKKKANFEAGTVANLRLDADVQV